MRSAASHEICCGVSRADSAALRYTQPQRSVSAVHERAMSTSVKISRHAGIAKPLCDHHPLVSPIEGDWSASAGLSSGQLLNSGGTPGEVDLVLSARIADIFARPCQDHDRVRGAV